MRTGGPPPRSERPFEDTLLDALLAVHEDLQREALKRKASRAWSRVWKTPRRSWRGPQAYSRPPWSRPDRRGPLALVGAVALSGAIVAGSFAFFDHHNQDQKVSTAPGGGHGKRRPGAQGSAPAMLFVADYDDSDVVEYSLQGGNGSPKVTLNSLSIFQPQHVLFDAAGNLWVANAGSVTEFGKDELTRSSAQPLRTISGGVSFAGMSFDSSGNLWVDDWKGNQIFEYGRAQLTKTGSPAPEVKLSGHDLAGPFGLAFDAEGNLWIGNEGNGLLLEYTRSQILSSGSPVPKVAIKVGQAAEDVVFDSAGNLWTGDSYTAKILEYARKDLSSSSAKPAISIGTQVSGLDGLWLDPSGNLWVTGYYGQQIFEFSKSQLHSSALARPFRALTEKGGGPVALTGGP